MRRSLPVAASMDAIRGILPGMNASATKTATGIGIVATITSRNATGASLSPSTMRAARHMDAMLTDPAVLASATPSAATLAIAAQTLRKLAGQVQ